MVIRLLKQYLTKELIEKFKDEAFDYLEQLAKNTDNKLDDALIRILRESLD